MSESVGIIGYGRIGAEHARWIASAGGIVAGVADPTPARREQAERGGYTTYSDVQTLLRQCDAPIILVASPTAMHAEQATAALTAGRHVMVEKPIALDPPTTRRLADLAEQQRRVISVFHNRRWDPDFLAVRNAVESGMFGRVINVESRIGQFASCVGPAAREYRPNWRNERDFGGGGLFDWGSHLLDQLWQLMLPARPIAVFAQLRGNLWSSDCDDFARVCVNFDTGAVGMVEINTTTTRPLPRWHIDGTAGSADSPFSLDFDVRTWAKLNFTSPGAGSTPLPPGNPGMDEPAIWRGFLDACRNDSDPPVTIQSVLPTMALLDAARKSSELGRVVEIGRETS